MKTIVHVVISLNVGGAERMIERLVMESSKNSSIRQTVICLREIGKLGNRLKNQGVEVLSLDAKSILGTPVAFYKLVKIFMATRPDGVYAWMYHSMLLGGLAAFFTGTSNVIWMIRNSEIPQGKFSITSLIIKICSVLSSHIVDKIVCNSEAGRIAHRKLGFCVKNMIVVPNGYDFDSFQPNSSVRDRVRRELNLSADNILVGIVGRFDPLKDISNFVQAGGMVSKNIDNVRFLMVGRGLDQDNTELAHRIDATQYPDRFIMLGERDPHDLYCSMDRFCLSSKAEGFPNVVAEAMAMGIPCVVTDVGDAAKILSDSGVIVEPMDHFALYEGLMTMLLKNDQQRQYLGRKAQEIVESRYSISRVSEKLLDLVD
jgi:glycosyltransferase involved in cell wall biosynthesis